MAKCRNPECVNGLAPGVKISGRGKNGAPLFGQGGVQRKDPMHWAWVSCLCCSPQKDMPFKLIRRTADEIAQRAQMASSKTEYKPKSEVGARLGNLARAASNAGPLPDIRVSSNGAGNAEMMAKLDKINENMSDLLEQIKELRAENKALKAENARLSSGVNGGVAAEAKPS
jgi:hypothetical protein